MFTKTMERRAPKFKIATRQEQIAQGALAVIAHHGLNWTD